METRKRMVPWTFVVCTPIILVVLGGVGVGLYFMLKYLATGQAGTGRAKNGNATLTNHRPSSSGTTNGSNANTQQLFYGLNYSPYGLGNDVLCPPFTYTGDQCLSSTQVTADMKQLSTLTNRIKLYSVLCPNATRAILDYATSNHMSVILGVAIGSDDTMNNAELQRLGEIMQAYGSTGVVTALVVGNEAVLIEGAGVRTLSAAIQEVKRIVQWSGSTAKVGSADVAGMWLGQPNPAARSAEGMNGPDMTPVVQMVDFIGLNAHAYYSGVDPASSDGSSVAAQQIATVSSYWGAKGYNVTVWVAESGFPSDGPSYNGVSPSLAGLNAFVGQDEQYSRANGVPMFYFEPFDADWKRRWAPGNDADFHFGLMYCNRTLKPITLPQPGAL